MDIYLIGRLIKQHILVKILHVGWKISDNYYLKNVDKVTAFKEYGGLQLLLPGFFFK
jgi:hypothetical protein